MSNIFTSQVLIAIAVLSFASLALLRARTLRAKAALRPALLLRSRAK